MKFEQTMTLPASKERVWAFVMDVPRVAQCIPGLKSIEALGDDKYAAVVSMRVGPIVLALKSEITVTERDEAAGTAGLRMEAADKRVGGAVRATMTMRLVPAGEGTTLTIETDAQVMGRIGDFGQPVIRKKADQMLDETAKAMHAALSEAAV